MFSTLHTPRFSLPRLTNNKRISTKYSVRPKSPPIIKSSPLKCSKELLKASFQSSSPYRLSSLRFPYNHSIISNKSSPKSNFTFIIDSKNASEYQYLNKCQFRLCQTKTDSLAQKSKFSEWKDSTIERIKAKKAQVLVEYGSTFIVLHELFGISSYCLAFSLLHFGVVNLDDVLNWMGFTAEQFTNATGLNTHGLAATSVAAIVLLKCMDILGLTPLRWLLAILLTPRIAWWVGPKVDRLVETVKRLTSRRSVAPLSSIETLEANESSSYKIDSSGHASSSVSHKKEM